MPQTDHSKELYEKHNNCITHHTSLIPILLSSTNTSFSTLGTAQFPRNVKVVAVLGLSVISTGSTVNAGIATFLTTVPDGRVSCCREIFVDTSVT